MKEWYLASRLGKLDPGMALEDMASCLEAIGVRFLQIKISHVTVAADPEPGPKDPFDRLLMAQCDVEGLLLVTVDRALAGHRLTLTF